MIDASAAEMRISISVDSDEADRAAAAAPGRPVDQRRRSCRETLGASSTAIVSSNSRKRALVVETRPGREQREFGGEIFRPDVLGLQHQHDADQQLRHPERRGEIAHDPGQEMLAGGERRSRLLGSTRMCCRLPWHQRRSRAARSISDGGLSS